MIFQTLQKQRDDKFDLASFLIKPVQRIRHYSLLLQVSIKKLLSKQIMGIALITFGHLYKFQEMIKAIGHVELHPKISELKVMTHCRSIPLNVGLYRIKVARLDFLGVIPPKFEH